MHFVSSERQTNALITICTLDDCVPGCNFCEERKMQHGGGIAFILFTWQRRQGLGLASFT
jgi:hypothetical protein